MGCSGMVEKLESKQEGICSDGGVEHRGDVCKVEEIAGIDA